MRRVFTVLLLLNGTSHSLQGQATFWPPSIPNLSLWLHTDTLLSVSAGQITGWTNIVNNAIQFAPPTTAKRPTLANNVLNGKPVVRFDGTDDVLSAGDVLDLDGNSRTMFVVGGRLGAATVPGAYFAKARATNVTNRFGLFANSSSYNFLYHDNTSRTITVTPNPGGMNLFSTVINRGTQQIRQYRRGIQEGNTVSGIQNSSYVFNSTNRLLLGAYNNATDTGEVSFLNGDIAEVLFYDRALSDSERTAVEQYLRFKYAPQIDLGQDITVNYGYCTQTLHAGTSFSNYQWSTGANTPSISVTQSGIYWVTARDLFGYFTSDTIEVSFSNRKNMSDTTICLGEQSALDLGLTGPYIYLWNTGASTGSILVANAGTYTLTVTDTSGCSYADTVIVQTDSFKLNISLGADINTCAGNSIGLTQGASLVSSYLWSTGSAANQTTVSNNGSYSVTVQNSAACVASDTIDITIVGQAPVLNFTADTVCAGSTTTFIAQISIQSPAVTDSIEWIFSPGITSNIANPTYIFPSAGKYSVLLRVVSDAGCASTITDTVIVKTVPDVSFTVNSEACINNPYSFVAAGTAGAGSSITGYFWDFGTGAGVIGNTATYTYAIAGNYMVQLIGVNTNACNDTAQQTLTVVSSAPPVAAVALVHPPNGSINTPNNITFNWTKVALAQSYIWELSATAAFTNILSTQTTADTVISISNLPISGTYYWRVKALNICGVATVSAVRIISFVDVGAIPNLSLWLRTDTLLSVSAGQITGWTNIVNNAIQFAPPTTAKRPTLVNNVLNGKPVVRFDGTDDVLSTGDVLDLDGNSRTIFIVGGRLGAVTVSGTYFAKARQANATNRFSLLADNSSYSFLYHDNTNRTISVSPNPGGMNLFSTVINRGTQQMRQYRRGIQEGNTVSGIQNSSYVFNSTNRLLLGAYNNATDAGEVSFLNGDIAEVLFYDRALSDSERTAVEQYLRFRYAPQIDLGQDIVITYGVCDTILTLPPFFRNILWSTGDTGLSATIKKAGTYWVTAQDIFGYMSSDTIEIQFPFKGLNLKEDTVVCAGNSVTLSAIIDNGPYAFLWNTGSQADTTNVFLPGKYFVQIQDTGGCTIVSDTITLQVDSFAFVSLLNDTIITCIGNQVTPDTTSLCCYTYLWSDNSIQSSFLVTTGGNINLSVENVNGCVNVDSSRVIVKGKNPATDFSVQSACVGDTLLFNDSVTVFSPEKIVSYWWNFGDFTTSNEQNPKKTYSNPNLYPVELIVTTDSGCVGKITKPVKVSSPPVASFAYNGILCAEASYIFSDNSIPLFGDVISSWKWYWGANDSSMLQNPIIAFPLPGQYEVTQIVATNTGCVDTVTQSVEVFSPIEADFTYTGVCLGDSTYFFDISNSLSIVAREWRLSPFTPVSTLEQPVFKYNSPGMYTVSLQIENAIGCTDTTSKTVEIVSAPQVVLNNQNACIGTDFVPADSVIIPASDSIQNYVWNIAGNTFVNSTPVFLFDSVGNFNTSLTITTTKGCVDSALATVSVKPLPEAFFTFSPFYGQAPVTINFDNQSTGASAYSWAFGDGSSSTNENPVYTYLQDGDYDIVLEVISDFGCKDTQVLRFSAVPTSLDISVDEITYITATLPDGSTEVKLKATISNVGTRVITNYTLYATLGSGGTIAETWNGQLFSGQVMEFAFNAGFVKTSTDLNSFACVNAVSVNNGEEENVISNNRQCVSLDNLLQVVGPLPNPSRLKAVAGIILPKAGSVQISVSNALGQYVVPPVTLTLPEGRTDYELPVAQLLSSTYVLNVIYNDEKVTRKFVVQR